MLCSIIFDSSHCEKCCCRDEKWTDGRRKTHRSRRKEAKRITSWRKFVCINGLIRQSFFLHRIELCCSAVNSASRLGHSNRIYCTHVSVDLECSILAGAKRKRALVNNVTVACSLLADAPIVLRTVVRYTAVCWLKHKLKYCAPVRLWLAHRRSTCCVFLRTSITITITCTCVKQQQSHCHVVLPSLQIRFKKTHEQVWCSLSTLYCLVCWHHAAMIFACGSGC